jgi:hypothetical protein
MPKFTKKLPKITIRAALRPVLRMVCKLPVAEFTPKCLKLAGGEGPARLVGAPHHASVRRIRLMCSWAVEDGLSPAAIAGSSDRR